MDNHGKFPSISYLEKKQGNLSSNTKKKTSNLSIQHSKPSSFSIQTMNCSSLPDFKQLRLRTGGGFGPLQGGSTPARGEAFFVGPLEIPWFNFLRFA